DLRLGGLPLRHDTRERLRGAAVPARLQILQMAHHRPDLSPDGPYRPVHRGARLRHPLAVDLVPHAVSSVVVPVDRAEHDGRSQRALRAAVVHSLWTTNYLDASGTTSATGQPSPPRPACGAPWPGGAARRRGSAAPAPPR